MELPGEVAHASERGRSVAAQPVGAQQAERAPVVATAAVVVVAEVLASPGAASVTGAAHIVASAAVERVGVDVNASDSAAGASGHEVIRTDGRPEFAAVDMEAAVAGRPLVEGSGIHVPGRGHARSSSSFARCAFGSQALVLHAGGSLLHFRAAGLSAGAGDQESHDDGDQRRLGEGPPQSLLSAQIHLASLRDL